MSLAFTQPVCTGSRAFPDLMKAGFYYSWLQGTSEASAYPEPGSTEDRVSMAKTCVVSRRPSSQRPGLLEYRRQGFHGQDPHGQQRAKQSKKEKVRAAQSSGSPTQQGLGFHEANSRIQWKEGRRQMNPSYPQG